MTATLPTILAIHLVSVASPGPDFAVVTHRSLAHGRKAGLLTAAGITAGLTAHLLFAWLGLGALIAAFPAAARFIAFGGALYLGWMAWGCLRSTGSAPETKADAPRRGDFVAGLLTNLLNPKVVLYFAGLFSQVIGPDVPARELGLAAAGILVVTLVWFSFVATAFSSEPVLRIMEKHRRTFDRAIGVMLGAFAILLIVRAW